MAKGQAATLFSRATDQWGSIQKSFGIVALLMIEQDDFGAAANLFVIAKILALAGDRAAVHEFMNEGSKHVTVKPFDKEPVEKVLKYTACGWKLPS